MKASGEEQDTTDQYQKSGARKTEEKEDESMTTLTYRDVHSTHHVGYIRKQIIYKTTGISQHPTSNTQPTTSDQQPKVNKGFPRLDKRYLIALFALISSIATSYSLRRLPVWPDCPELPKLSYGKITCTDGVRSGSICVVDCLQNHKKDSDDKTGPVCNRDGEWSHPFPNCICDPCKFGDNCEKMTSWEDFRRDISEDGGVSHLVYAGHAITCDGDKLPHLDGFELKFKCKCTDPVTREQVRCKAYQSRYGACEHSSAELIRRLVQRGVYPKPCDEGKMVTGC